MTIIEDARIRPICLSGSRISQKFACRVFKWESEAPAELASQWFGRNLVERAFVRRPFWRLGRYLTKEELDDTFWATPSIANNSIYLRGIDGLYCIRSN